MQRENVFMKPRSLARLSSFFLCLTLGLGCANIAGLSNLKDKDEDDDFGGSSGRGGSLGKGGSSGIGGSSGKGGSDQGGDAGEGATSNSGGSSGSSGSGGTGPVGCRQPTDLNEDVIRSCILAESCYPFAPDVGISNCVTYNVQDAFTGRSCASKAKSCDDILDCNGISVLYPGAPVECEDNLSRCEGNYAVNCGGLNDFPPHFIDCATLGGTCSLRPDEIADCIVLDSCSEPDPIDGGNYAVGCDGDNFYYCAGGVGFGQDCQEAGAECVITDDGRAGCYYSVTSCTTDSVSCANGDVVQCSGGARYEFKCSRVGLECAIDQENGLSYSYCLAPGCTVDDWLGCEERCSGSKLTFCYGGAPVTVDCKDYGFDTCKTIEPYAICTNR